MVTSRRWLSKSKASICTTDPFYENEEGICWCKPDKAGGFNCGFYPKCDPDKDDDCYGIYVHAVTDELEAGPPAPQASKGTDNTQDSPDLWDDAGIGNVFGDPSRRLYAPVRLGYRGYR